MAEDLCLMQYVRDYDGEECIQNYVNDIADDDNGIDLIMDTYCLDFNTFTEFSRTFDHSTARPGPDASNPVDSRTSPFAPDDHSLQVSSPLLNNLLPTLDRPHLKDSNQYPMLAACIGSPQANVITLPEELIDLQGRQGQRFKGNVNTSSALDNLMLQSDHSGGSCAVRALSTDSRRTSSFWRGKSPAFLMQQLKGPSLSACSSSSSEARSTVANPTLQGPRSLSTLSNHEYPTSVDETSTLASAYVPTLSKSAPSLINTGGQTQVLPPLQGEHVTVPGDNFVSHSRRVHHQGQSPRILRSSRFDTQLIASKLGADVGTSISADLKQRGPRKMPGLSVFGEMAQLGNCAASGNSYSRSTSSTSKSESRGPSTGLDREVAAMSGDRARKKAKAEPSRSSYTSPAEQNFITADVAAAIAEQTEKSQLQAKFLTLLRPESSTSKDCKAPMLGDSGGYLKDVRKRLNVNEGDSAHKASEPVPTLSGGLKHQDGTLDDGLTRLPVRLEDLELETAGVEISRHVNVDNGPQIEVRMMENQHVMVKLTAKDRPGLFNDITALLRSLRLDIQHANIRTGNNGQRHDIFAAKMQLPFYSSQSTHAIAMALSQVINSAETPKFST